MTMNFDSLHLSDRPLSGDTLSLFKAYQLANGMDDATSRDFLHFLESTDTRAPGREWYKAAEAFDESQKLATASIVRHLNSFFHLESVVQEIRRQSLRRQIDRKMWKALRPPDGQPPILPLPYGSYMPGGWAEWLFPHINRHGQIVEPLTASPDELVALVGQIVPERVFTQHPTNSNTVETNQVVAEMVAAGLEVVCPNDGASAQANAEWLTKTLQTFAAIDRIPVGNFTVGDEIDLSNNATLNFLNGRHESLHELMCLAEERFGNSFTLQHKVQLVQVFRARLGDWAAGDKDNNDNVKAEHRLLKVAKQRRMMALFYIQQLDELKDEGVKSTEFNERRKQLTNLSDRLDNIVADIRSFEKDDGDIPMPHDKIEEISASINQACVFSTGNGYQDFVLGFIDDSMKACLTGGIATTKIICLINDLQTSGMHGYHTELRENCGFSAEVFMELARYLPITQEAFKGQSKNDQLATLDHYIRQPGVLQRAADALIADAKKQAVNDRSYESPLIKAYHTLVSLRLTQEHSGCFENIVLAETRQSNDILTALALQVAGQVSRHPHWLNIVALFEDPESLRDQNSILHKVMVMKGFRAFLTRMKGYLQAMFAHSDSWRLAGRIAADGLLALARKKYQTLQGLSVEAGGKTVKLIISIFDGLSQSDPSRSGGRDQIGTINDPIKARHSKATVQGNDQANYYNSPSSVARGLVKDMTKAAKVLLGKIRPADDDLENIVSQAAQATHDAYSIRHFFGDMPQLLAHPFFNYILNGLVSNFSSRSTSRKQLKASPWDKNPPKVDLENSRAISVSTTFFYANIVNNWYVADIFEHNLAEKISSNPAMQNKITDAGRNLFPKIDILVTEDGRLTAFAASTLYHISVEYRRHIDKMVQGVALTDLDVNHMRRARAAEAGIPDKAMTPRQEQTMYAEYCAAARLGILSFTGKESPYINQQPSLELCAALKAYTQDKVLPMEDRDYLERHAMIGIAIRDRVIVENVSTGGLDIDNWHPMLRELDNGLNRVRGPHLNNNDVAEAFFIRQLSREFPERPPKLPYIQAVEIALVA